MTSGEKGGPVPEKPASAARPSTQRWQAAANQLRGRVDLTAKALGGLGTTAVTAVGLARIGDLFPIPPGWVSWLWFSLAIGGFIALASAVLIVTYRLWSVNQPISMRTDPDAMHAQGDVDVGEREQVRLVYQQTADLNRVPSLRAYEARAHRLARIAARTEDDLERGRRETAVAEITADIEATYARAALRVLRRRTTNAIRGTGSVVAYVLLVGGILLFALGTDYVSSERAEQVTIAKSCADARKAGANAATLPAICGADMVTAEMETTSLPRRGTPEWEISEEDLRGFRPRAEVHAGPLRARLCLVQYFDRRPEARRTSRWWTSCVYAKKHLRTIADVRERLALPKSWKWSRRDARVFAEIPAGDSVSYVKGIAAAQCPRVEARCYHGGGVQFRLLNIERRWVGQPECLHNKDESIPAVYGHCHRE